MRVGDRVRLRFSGRGGVRYAGRLATIQGSVRSVLIMLLIGMFLLPSDHLIRGAETPVHSTYNLGANIAPKSRRRVETCIITPPVFLTAPDESRAVLERTETETEKSDSPGKPCPVPPPALTLHPFSSLLLHQARCARPTIPLRC